MTLSRRERLLLIALAAVSTVLRALAYFRYRFDSDEPQHLHVAWGWTQGLVQYRDLFDNHTPLFHLLTAPILAMFGERADILLWMRAPMLLLFAIVVAGTFIVARRLYDTRVALWSALLLSLFPTFFLKSLEYRNDNLWNALWMLALMFVVARPFTAARAFAAGFLLGCAFAASIKTVLLLVALPGAAFLAWRRAPLREIASAIAGFAIVPTALAAYFIGNDAWDELVYCVFTFHSIVLESRAAWIGRALYPLALAVVAFIAWRWRSGDPWRRFLIIAIALYTITVAGVLGLVTSREFLPLLPLLAILAAATLRTPARLASAAAVFIAALFYYADGFRNGTSWHITMMNQVLTLTRARELVMDIKGETVYRRRPFYYIFEVVTREQIRRGRIADTVPEAMLATRCYVAQADGYFPPRSGAFLRDNYVDVGRLRVAGKWIEHDSTFTLALPGEYVILTHDGLAKGTLDGMRFTGPRFLAAGPHRFVRDTYGVDAVAVWAPSFQRGFSPFHKRDTEY